MFTLAIFFLNGKCSVWDVFWCTGKYSMLQNTLWCPLCLRRLSNWAAVHLGSQASPFCIVTVLLSGEQSRAPFQLVFGWDSSALCFTKLFPQHANLKCFAEISVSEGSPELGWEECSSLSLLLWTFGEDFSECAEPTHTCLQPWKKVTSTCCCCCWCLFSPVISGSQQPGVPYYTDPGGPVMNPMAMAFHVQPNSPQGNPVYPPPPSYCNTPPPPYEQEVKSSTWGLCGSLTWLWEKMPLQNNQDGGRLSLWTLASFPCPHSFPTVHLSSLNLLAKGWFFFSFFAVEVDFFFVFKMKEVVFVMLLMEIYI